VEKNTGKTSVSVVTMEMHIKIARRQQMLERM
jgi:hypothetical protein